MKTETKPETKPQTKPQTLPFFANAAALGSLSVKSHVKAGRKQEQNDK